MMSVVRPSASWSSACWIFDSVTLSSALAHLAEGRTTLIIAHRLSTIRSASRILVVADGRICEQGTHEELMRLGGLYATLRSTQDLSSAE